MTGRGAPPPRRYPELEGAVAVITGAARGIGRAIAKRLVSERMRVVAVDIDEPTLDGTVEQLRGAGGEITGVQADVGRTADVDALFAGALSSHGTVDLLVNNAADLRRVRLLEEHDSLLDEQLATNVRGPYLCSQRAAAIMRDSGGGGSIVHLSSVGAVRAHHRAFPYDVTKGAIDALTRAMAVDLGGFGIRVNAIGPGVTDTGRPVADPASASTTAERIPLGRSGTPDDIAALVAFLASDDAAYITGQVIYVDGGITAQLSPRGPDGLERSDRSAS